MTFEVHNTDAASDARAGLITTDHGQILTPIFMPVGTVGSVKGVHFSELREQVKAQIILGNTAACISSTLGIAPSLLTRAVFRYSHSQASVNSARKVASFRATSMVQDTFSHLRM